MSPNPIEAIGEIIGKIEVACGKHGWIKDAEIKHWLVDNIITRLGMVRGQLESANNAAIDGREQPLETREEQEEQAVAPVPSVVRRFHDLLREELGINECQLSDDTSFEDDLGADSLNLVEIVMAVEEEFGIDIPFYEVENIKTVGQAIEYIKSRGF
jgi:acyl carrier protein